MEQIITAETLFEHADYKRASLTAKKAMDKLMKVGNYTEAVRALEIRANSMHALQDSEKATMLLGEVLGEFKQKGETHFEILVTSLIADASLSKGDTQGALRKAEEAKELAKDRRDGIGEAVALRTLAKINIQLGELDEAIRFSYRVADIMQECKDLEAQAFELYSIAQLHLHARQFSDSIVSAKKAVSLFRKVANKEAEANAFRVGAEASWHAGVLRVASWQEGRNDCALSMCLAALELYKYVGNVQKQIATGIMVAKLFFELHDYEEASEMAMAMWQISMKANSSKAEIMESIKLYIDALTSRHSARKSTATLKTQRGWLQAAVDAAKELVALSMHLPKPEQAEANRILAKALLVKETALSDGSVAHALQAAEKYLDCAVQSQDRGLQAAALLLLAELHFHNKDINAAIEANNRAEEMYKDAMDVFGQAKVESLRSKFRFSDQWSKVRVKASDGSLRKAIDVEKEAMPAIATGWKNATLYIHFDNLQARAAKNIG
mmetsp:Transcript_2771/g.4193  ORF Transcript_2771/g.4193 Transcript_2771/m.4193 type:complete len:497 (+) Transcript_2771:72-1562(+)